MSDATVYGRVMVSGNRPNAFDEEQARWGRQELHRTLRRLQHFHGTSECLTGLALGADSWWAESASRLNIPYAAYIPFEGQANTWSPEERKRWARLRFEAAREEVFGDHYDVRLFHERNDAMLCESDLLVALHCGALTKGGTASVVAKARKLGKPMILLDAEARSVNTENMG